MNDLKLSFNGFKLKAIDMNDGQFWVTSSQLAEMLEYKQSRAITKIYNRNADEFTDSMTKNISNPHVPNLDMRIFNLRGCHLLAMFARTDKAKEFRRWVLDVLDNEVARSNATRNSLMFKHNEACYQLKIATEIASSAGYNLNKYGKTVKPELADRVTELERQMQLILDFKG